MSVSRILKTTLKFSKNIWIIRIYLLILLVGIIVYFIRNKDTLAEISKVSYSATVFLILIICVVIFLGYVYAHYSTYQALGAEISYWQAFQVTALSRLGVYIPGKIFYATNYFIFSRLLHIGSDIIGKNFIINNAILFFTGALCSVFALAQLPFVARYLMLVLPVLMLVLIHPRVLDSIFKVLISKLSQFFPEGRNSDSSDFVKMPWNYWMYLKFIGIYMVLWIVLGVMLFLCIQMFEQISINHFPIVLAAAASGLIIGLLAVFAPGGIGVREGIGVVILSQIVSVETAVFATVLLRLAHVITDFMVGGISTIGFLRKKHSSDAKETDNAKI